MLRPTPPLDGKGSTLFLPYYGAMYEAGAISPLICSDIMVIGSNTVDRTVHDAIEGFSDGHATNLFNNLGENIYKPLNTVYLADQAGQGYIISDSTALRTIRSL
jgi:basic membrane protein A